MKSLSLLAGRTVLVSGSVECNSRLKHCNVLYLFVLDLHGVMVYPLKQKFRALKGTASLQQLFKVDIPFPFCGTPDRLQ